jgi:hypothetical protein
LSGAAHTYRLYWSKRWPFAARYGQAVTTSEKVIGALQSDSRFEVARVPSGTNIFFLRVKGVNAEAFQRRAQDAGFILSSPRNDRFTVLVNETWAPATPQKSSPASSNTRTPSSPSIAGPLSGINASRRSRRHRPD